MPDSHQSTMDKLVIQTRLIQSGVTRVKYTFK